MFQKPLLIIIFLFSIFLVALSVIVTFIMDQPITNVWTALTIIFLAQIGGSILFPMLVSYFYDKFKQKQEVETIWAIFQDLSEGGIMRVYKDREENPRLQNAKVDLHNAFDRIRDGEVRLIGVSLRVFFNETGPFFRGIYRVCEQARNNRNMGIRALISHPDSPEVENRASIETPYTAQDDPLIKIDIRSTIASIGKLNRNFSDKPIECGYYYQAPYCTCILFPDKCYFSPNILAKEAPVRLPMIVFQKDPRIL